MSTYATQPAQTQDGPPQRSFAGPIVLIALGVLLLLGNLHVLPWAGIRHYFARYWPVLIILWGVIKLIEYFAAQHEGRRYRAIGAGGVVLIVFLCIAGFTVTGLDRVNWSAMHDEFEINDGWWNGPWGAQTYNFTQELQQDWPAGASLRVTSDRGAVTINPWDQKQIKVSVAKRVRAENQDDASKVDQSTRPQLTATGLEVILNANTSAGGNRWVASDLEIFLPRDVAVEIATRNGDVNVRSRNGNVQISNSRAAVNLDDINGNVSINLRRGSARITKVTGNVTVDGEIEQANASDVGGSVTLNGGVTDTLTLARVAKGVRYQSNRTTLEFAKLDGDITLGGGDLNGKQLVGPLRLSTRSKDIHLDEVSGDVRVENTNGTIEIQPKLPLGSMELSNRRGSIRVVLPAKAGFQLDARTRRGEINSDFPGLSIQTGGHLSTASGSIGNGAAKLQIDNDGGDVEIRKAG